MRVARVRTSPAASGEEAQFIHQSMGLKIPHPDPMASQARHQMDAPSYGIASRIVVPPLAGRGSYSHLVFVSYCAHRIGF